MHHPASPPPTSVPDTQARAPITSLVLLTGDLPRAIWLSSIMQAHAQVLPAAMDSASLQSTLDQAQPPARAVVVEFAASTLTQASQLVQEIRAQQPGLPIIALGSASEPALTLAALRAGVMDFIDPSMDAEDIRRTLVRLLQQAPAVPMHVPPAGAQPRGKVVAIVGARTGLGVTTLATHLSVLLQLVAGAGTDTRSGHDTSAEQRSQDSNALLLDLGLPARDGQMYLNAHGDYSALDAIQNMHRLDKTLLEAAVARHDSGTCLLSWPVNLQLLRGLSPGSVGSLAQRLRDFWSWQVLDWGGFTHLEVLLPTLKECDAVWIVCDQSVGGLISTTELLRQMRQQSPLPACTGLVVNRFMGQSGLPAQAVADRLELPLLATIQDHGADLLYAASQGKLVFQSGRTSPYVQSVQQLVRVLLGKEAQAPLPSGGNPSSFGEKWRQWKAQRNRP